MLIAPQKPLSILALSIALTACGSGGTDSTTQTTSNATNTSNTNNKPNTSHTTTDTTGSTDSTNSNTAHNGSATDTNTSDTETGTHTNITNDTTNTAKTRLATAYATGNANPLNTNNLTSDTQLLLQQAVTSTQSLFTEQQNLLKHLFYNQGNTINQTLAYPKSSVIVQAGNPVDTLTIAKSDQGIGMAAIGTMLNSRQVGYGINIMQQLVSKNSNYSSYAPLFKRVLTWAITGNADGKLPSTLNIATQNYSANTVSSYFSQYGTTTKNISCDLYDAQNTCWQQADVLFLGTGKSPDNIQALLKKYMAAGKVVIYQAAGWWASYDNNNDYLLLNGMGMQGYAGAGNYWQSLNKLEIASTRTPAESILQADTIANLSSVLSRLQNRDNSMVNWEKDTQYLPAIQRISHYLRSFNQTGESIFNQSDNTLLRQLVILADILRLKVNYAGLSKNSDSLIFLQTYIADAWLDFNRSHTTVSPNGAGDYMPATANNLPVSTEWETLTIQLPQNSGVTLIGRASIPAKAIQIQIVDAKNASLKLQTSYLRTVGSPLSDKGYQHPVQPNSPAIAISKQTSTFNSPFGGPLMLSYSGATAGQNITIRVKGVAKYAHFDFTKPMTNAEMIEAQTALQNNQFGWNTIKLVGSEIQQTTHYARKAMGNFTPNQYVVERIKPVIFDSNHIANGYNNMPLDNQTNQYCQTLGWDCNSDVHRAPNIQHFVGWIATCGYLCSGNPVDAYTGVDVGWGWAHELGHNTVQPVLSMVFTGTTSKSRMGCQVECDNNILAGLTMLRKYQLLGEDTNGSNFAHWQLYNQLQASRNTGKQGENLRVDMENRLWSGDGYTNPNAKQAVHMQLAMLFTKLQQKKGQPDIQGVYEFFRLLNTANRLVKKLDLSTVSNSDKNKYGLGSYSKKDYTNPELIYMLSSKIVGYDLKDVFTLYGLPISSTAHQSVEKLQLPTAPLSFYAQPKGRANHLNEGKWLTLSAESKLPNYPY